MSSSSITAPVVEISPATAKSQPASRIGALDWTKGALVLCMVAYHAINYSAFRPMAFKALGFLPPSFILITGFLVGQVYAARYRLDTWKPYVRLLIRGFKLLLIFLVLNVFHCIVLKRSILDGLWEFADRAGTIFVTGNGREGIFEVLLPIAYFLLLAPALLWLRSRYSAVIGLGAAGIFILCVLLERGGMSYKNLSFVSAGLLGMACGLVPIRSIDGLVKHWVVVLGLYAAYRVCSYHYGEIYAVQMFGAFASLALLYGCALRLDCESWLGRSVVLLGRYSLFGYLVQILLIQIIVAIAGGKPAHWTGVFALAVVATVLLFVLVQGLERFRNRSRLGDQMYRALFA